MCQGKILWAAAWLVFSLDAFFFPQEKQGRTGKYFKKRRRKKLERAFNPTRLSPSGRTTRDPAGPPERHGTRRSLPREPRTVRRSDPQFLTVGSRVPRIINSRRTLAARPLRFPRDASPRPPRRRTRRPCRSRSGVSGVVDGWQMANFIFLCAQGRNLPRRWLISLLFAKRKERLLPQERKY